MSAWLPRRSTRTRVIIEVVARQAGDRTAGQIAATGETRSADLSVTPGADDDTSGGWTEFDVMVAQWVP